MNKVRVTASLFTIALRNAWHWRFRLGIIAVLIALSLTLIVFQAGEQILSREQSVARIQPSPTRYYDLLVHVRSGKRILSLAQLPAPKYQRQIYAHGESATMLTAGTYLGELRLLGVNPQTHFFQIQEVSRDQGKPLLQQGEMMLPRSEAERLGLSLGSAIEVSFQVGFNLNVRTFVVADIFDQSEPTFAVLRLDDLLNLNPSLTANCFLVNYDRAHATLEQLIEWMSDTYPGAALYSDQTAELLGESLLQQMAQPNEDMLSLIVLFVFTSVFTVAFVTFLERRQELSILKSVGIDQGQLTAVLSCEYLLAALRGLCGGHILLAFFSRVVPWLGELNVWQAISLYLAGYGVIAVILALSLSYPLQMAKSATVNQLLFARTIPLLAYRVNRLEDSFHYLLREEDEGVRLLKIPVYEDKIICICTKQVGDTVKLGEVIAVHEFFGGLYYKEWEALCDGTVVDISTSSGLVAIRPIEPNKAEDAMAYAYQSNLMAEERRRANRLEAARQRVRDGTSVLQSEIDMQVSAKDASSEHNSKFTLKSSIITIFCVAFLIFMFTNMPRELTYAEKWRDDLTLIKTELPKRHPDLFFNMPEEEFTARMNALIASDHEKNRENDIAAEVLKIISDVGDGHTVFGPLSTERALAVRFFLFEDGVYALDTHVLYADIYGKKLTAVNGIPIDQVLERLRPFVSRDNIYLEKSRLGQAVSDIYLLKLAGVIDSGVEATYTFGEESYVLSFMNAPRATSTWISDMSQMHPVLMRGTQYYSYELLGQALYVHYSRCQEMPSYPFEQFTRDVFEILDSTIIERLIIDLRDNQGGDSRIFEPFIEAILLRPWLNTPQNLKVIVGRQTFSSGIFAACQLDRATNAEVIGEPTGGIPDHYGYPDNLDLYYFPYRLTYSTQYFDLDPENRDAFYPDIECILYAAEWFAGKDVFLDTALR